MKLKKTTLKVEQKDTEMENWREKPFTFCQHFATFAFSRSMFTNNNDFLTGIIY